MAGQDNDGSSSSQSNRGGRILFGQWRPSRIIHADDDEDYAAELFREQDGVDDTTSFDDMPPWENYYGPRVVIPPVPRHLNVADQWRFIFREYSRSRTFLVSKDYDIDDAKKRFGKK